jgi:hypothetical protein
LIEAGAQHVESINRFANDEFEPPDRSLPLRTSFVSRAQGNLSDLRQASHRDPSKRRAEAIEPAPDADGCDRKIAGRSVVNPFDMSVPRGDPSRRERPFAPQPSGNERRQMKADRLV